MTDQGITHLLNKMGWGSGFRLPISNHENRELENLLEVKQRRALQLRATLEEETKYKQNLVNEMGRVTFRLSGSSKLLSAGVGTVAHAKNLTGLAQRGYEHLQRDSKLKKKELSVMKERNYITRADIKRRKARIDELSKVLEWDKSALETIKQSTNDRENDIEFMSKYLVLDKKMASEVELKFESLGEALTKGRRELDSTVQQTQTIEQQYDRICRQFRRVHYERNQAVKFWKNTLDILKLRDKDIQHIANEFIGLRGKVIKLDQILTRKRGLLETVQRNKVEGEASLVRHDRQVSDAKLTVSKQKMRAKALSDEGMNLRTMINQASLAMKQNKDKTEALRQAMSSIFEHVVRINEAVEKLRERYRETQDGATSAEERLIQMNNMIEEEETKMFDLRKEADRLKKCLFQSVDTQTRIKLKLGQFDYEIKTAEMGFKKLKAFCKSQDYELHLKKQKVYKLELEVLSVKSRYAEVSHPDEADTFSSRYTADYLQHTRALLKEATKTKMTLMNQKGHMDDILRRLRKEVEQPEFEKIDLLKHLKNVETLQLLADKDDARFQQELQDTRFEFSMEKLRLNRLQKLTKNRRNKLSRLEQQRVVMASAACERRSEIQTHKYILEQKKKNLVETKTKFNVYINDITTQLKLWRAKYDIVMSTMTGGGEREGEGDYSEAYFILKQASERESLKREGDRWDKRVKEAEKELTGLQNTLAVIVNSNQAFRESLAPVVKGSDEYLARTKLEEAKQLALIRIRKAHKQSYAVLKRSGEKEREIQQLEIGMQHLLQTVQDRKYELNSILLEIANQKAKLHRASLVTRRMVRQLEHRSISEKTFLEAEIKLRCTREKYSFALKSLDRALAIHPDMKTPTLQYLKNHRHHRAFAKLVKQIEKQDYSSKVYTSPLGSGPSTPKQTPSQTRASSAQPLEE